MKRSHSPATASMSSATHVQSPLCRASSNLTSTRAKRLLEVRELFLPVYMKARKRSGASVWDWISGSWAAVFTRNEDEQQAQVAT